MKVMTVLGSVPPEDLGVTLPHEHVLFDSSHYFRPSDDPSLRLLGDSPVQMHLLGALRRNEFVLKDNLRLNDRNEMIEEVLHFKEAGGGTIVDNTPVGLNPNPQGLREISEATGVHIIASYAYYVVDSHPPSLGERSVEDIEEEMLKVLNEGIDNSGILPGLIGEIGLGGLMKGFPAEGPSDRAEIAPGEEKVLRAAARVQRATDVPMSIHTWSFGPNKLGVLALDIIEEEGGNPERVIMCHLDGRLDLSYIQSIAERGAYIELDRFGVEGYWQEPYYEYLRDSDRIKILLELVNRGHSDRLLLSHDVCTKIQLKKYGGWGYEHLIRNIVPVLRSNGMSEEEIQKMLVDNPARVLAF